MTSYYIYTIIIPGGDFILEIVKYHNDLNSLVFKTFKLKELDIFYTIIFKMKGKTEAIFSANEIKKIAITEKGNRSIERFFSSLDKVFKTQLQVLDGDGVTDYNLFITKKINPQKTEVTIELHPQCIYILNNLMKNYTKFELSEFLNLKSKYSKILFRHLKQFEGTGIRIFMMDDFKTLFGVPQTYQQYNINQKILKPTVRELRSIFKNLNYVKEKKGREINKIIFKWEVKKVKKKKIEEEILQKIEEQKKKRKEEEQEKAELKEREKQELKELIEYFTEQEKEKHYNEYLNDKYTLKEVVSFENYLIVKIDYDEILKLELKKRRNKAKPVRPRL
mgnify:CR=1 FL=1